MGRWHICLEKGHRLADAHQTKVRFLFAGLLNTAFGLGTYFALYCLLVPLKFHYLAILVVSHAVCMTFAFLTNKFLVFRTSGNYLREYMKFCTFQIPYFLMNLVALPILVELVGMDPVMAQIMFTILAIVSSYFWHSRVTFSASQMTN